MFLLGCEALCRKLSRHREMLKVRSALGVSLLTLRAGGKSKKRNAVGAASACEPRGRAERPLGDKRGGALASSASRATIPACASIANGPGSLASNGRKV